MSERLGHRIAELMRRVYAHLMPGDSKETARPLDATFGAYQNPNAAPKVEEGGTGFATL